jgi:hypothetical protein
VAASRFDHAAMLAKDERKTGIGTNTTPFIEAMSAITKSAMAAHAMPAPRVPEKAFEPEYIRVAR